MIIHVVMQSPLEPKIISRHPFIEPAGRQAPAVRHCRTSLMLIVVSTLRVDQRLQVGSWIDPYAFSAITEQR
ncbi:hypothetical protein [Nocardia salmonicida]|uniref:hypothetical protein n=1 Tax=Nocardia salmonicida TaxID=53431 RepID=UPI002E2C2498|nr:hypothetical protein [Nocardia salmonicida]